MKKVIVVVVIVLVAFGLYWFFYLMNNPAQKTKVTNELNSLFPYGISDNTTTINHDVGTSPSNTNSSDQSSVGVSYNPLIQLSKRSIVGMTVLPKGPVFLQNTIATSSTSTTVVDTSLPIVRFAEHGTGYVYDVDARANNETKKTSTTIVRAYEAYFGDAGQSIVYRYVKNDNSTIETYLGKIIPPAGGSPSQFATVKGDFLPENIPSIAMSPDGKSLAYLIATNDGTSAVSIDTDNTNKHQLFSSPYDEWLLDWKQNILTATTKASGGVSGYAYAVSSTGAFQKLIGGVAGLTTNASPDGKSILYDTSTKNKISLFIRHSNGDSTKLDIATLPEKCVWSKNSLTIYCAVPVSTELALSFPDDWYQGLTHFQDALWKVDVISGNATPISSLDYKLIDVVDPMLDPSENFIFFKNNNDGTPWSYDLRPVPTQTQTMAPVVPAFPVLDKKAQ